MKRRRRHARCVYEAGRLRWALRIGWPGMAIAALLAAADMTALSTAVALALIASMMALGTSSGRFWHSVPLGTAAGAAVSTAVLGVACWICPAAACSAWCVGAALVGGLMAAVVLVREARRAGALPYPAFVVALWMALLTLTLTAG